MEDNYKTLGVDTNISDDGLRKKFLHLAKLYHPDKNLGKNEAFKLLSTCYEAIVTDRKRRTLEETQFHMECDNTYEPDDVKTDPYTIVIELNEDEIIHGCRKQCKLTRQTPCSYCNSTGIHKHTHNMIVCKNCKDWCIAYKEHVICHICKGMSNVILNNIKCKVCKGVGIIEDARMENIVIPKFIEDESSVVHGDHTIHVTHNLEYIDRISNRTVFLTIPITLSDAFIGWSKKVQIGKEAFLTIQTKEGLFNFEKTRDVSHEGTHFNISFRIVFADSKILRKISHGLKQLYSSFCIETKSPAFGTNGITL